MTPKITESNQVMIMVRAAALDPMDVLVASGYGSFIRKFLIKHTLHVSMEISRFIKYFQLCSNDKRIPYKCFLSLYLIKNIKSKIMKILE